MKQTLIALIITLSVVVTACGPTENQTEFHTVQAQSEPQRADTSQLTLQVEITTLGGNEYQFGNVVVINNPTIVDMQNVNWTVMVNDQALGTERTSPLAEGSQIYLVSKVCTTNLSLVTSKTLPTSRSASGKLQFSCKITELVP